MIRFMTMARLLGITSLVTIGIRADERMDFVGKVKSLRKPTAGNDWKEFKDSNKRNSLLLPRGFIERNSPEDEKNTVLYCIAGGSLKDYRLAKIVSDPEFTLPEPTEKNLPDFAKAYLDHQISKRFMNAKILERTIVEIDGKKVFLIVSDGAAQGGFRVTLVSAIVRVHDATHQLSLSCISDNFEKYSDSFAQILLSWKLTQHTEWRPHSEPRP